MTDSREAAHPPLRAPLRRRSRRRWAIACGVAVCWLIAQSMTGSVVTATVLLVAFAGLGAVILAGLRATGITRDHPWLRRMATRPWRDGQDVLNVALRHLPDVFVVTRSGSVIAPDVVELQMNPGDLASLREWMELDVVSASVTEVYEDQAAKRGARFAGSCQPEVYVVPDDSLPQGRYRLRRGLPESARYSPGPWGLPDGPDLTDRQFAYAGQEYAATALDLVGAWPGDHARPEFYLGRTHARPVRPVRPASQAVGRCPGRRPEAGVYNAVTHCLPGPQGYPAVRGQTGRGGDGLPRLQ